MAAYRQGQEAVRGERVNIFKRLMGRAEQALNTARHHPDKHVQDDNHTRAKAYFCAVDDVKNDEEIRAGMHLAWMIVMMWEDEVFLTRSPEDREAIIRAVDDLKKHSPLLAERVREKQNKKN